MYRFKDVPLGKDRFRLFKLEPNSGEVEIKVKTFKIYRSPKYEAISYCWGDKSDGTMTIQCNGRPMEVWANLYAVLRRLQRENTGSWYWNDALCIEQGDEEGAMLEKARQIAFMETIFTLAEPVRVWLGDASQEEERAFQLLADTSERLAKAGVPRNATEMPGPNDEFWLYWSQVLIRPWFTRLWIVQESLVNAGKLIVTIGQKAQTTWANFHEMLERSGNVAWTHQRFLYNDVDMRAQLHVRYDFLTEWGVPLDMRDTDEGRGLRNDALNGCIYRNLVNIRELLFLEKYHDAEYGFLQQLLKVFGNRKCSYDQDRPNAMRGVLTDQLKKGLKVYGTHADIPTVYREVTRVWLTNDPKLYVLQRIRPLRKFLPECDKPLATKLTNPSWVIDLGRVVNEVLGGGIPNRFDGFHAGLVKRTSKPFGKPEWTVPGADVFSRFRSSRHVQFPTENECHIAGFQVGTIQSVVPFKSSRRRQDLYPSRELLEGQMSEFLSWINESLRLIQNACSDPESHAEVHWRVLVINRTDTKDPEVNTMFDIDHQHSRRKAYENVMSSLRSGRLDSLRGADEPTVKYYEAIHLYLHEFPNWFSTENGHVGRSYAVPEAGDVLAVFYGASTPFLLRPLLGQNTYIFMGEAYVHGVMQGECLLEKNRPEYPKRVFKLT